MDTNENSPDPTRRPLEHASRQELHWILKEAMDKAESGARQTAASIRALRARGTSDADIVKYLREQIPAPDLFGAVMEMVEDVDPEALDGLPWRDDA